MCNLKIKRVYDPLAADDGLRILVDRLWPRGVKKADAKIDLWPKELTPSHELRKWYHANLTSKEEFQSRYHAELDDRYEAIEELIGNLRGKTCTLVTASKQAEQGHVGILKAYLEAHTTTDRHSAG